MEDNSKGRVEALGRNVIVDPLYDPDRVETGLSPGAPALILPDSAKNPMSQQGIVISSGNPDVEEGDHVLYHPFIGTPIRRNGYEYLRVEYRHLVGFLDESGDLWPLPGDVVVRPIFGVAGRPVLEGLIWVPKQLHHVDIPSAGYVVKVGERAGIEVVPGQVVIFPPNRGAEVGLRQVFYTIPGREVLATLEREVPVTVRNQPAWWQVPDQERGHASNPN